MQNDERSGRARAGVPAAANRQEQSGGVWRRPAVLAAATGLVGLALGVIIGRETVEEPSRVERALVAAPHDTDEGKVQEEEAPPAPKDRYSVRFTRSAKGGDGFAQDDTTERVMAVISDKEARLHFEIAPGAASYALSAIVRVKDGTSGNLKVSIDNHALGSWALSGEWAAYTLPIGRELLSEGPHELAFSVNDLQPSALVGLDSVAVEPVGDELAIVMGPEAAGHLVAGFSKFEGKTVWSLGPRSTLAAVLGPKPGAYQLRVRGYALPTLAPLQVSAKVNGKDIGAVPFQSKTGESTWNVPPNVLHAGLNEIELAYEKTARPVDYNPRSKDKRALALRYSRVALSSLE